MESSRAAGTHCSSSATRCEGGACTGRAGSPRLSRRLANAVTGTLFTDINSRLGDILKHSGAPLRIGHDEPAMLGGTFRIVLLRKA